MWTAHWLGGEDFVFRYIAGSDDHVGWWWMAVGCDRLQAPPKAGRQRVSLILGSSTPSLSPAKSPHAHGSVRQPLACALALPCCRCTCRYDGAPIFDRAQVITICGFITSRPARTISLRPSRASVPFLSVCCPVCRHPTLAFSSVLRLSFLLVRRADCHSLQPGL